MESRLFNGSGKTNYARAGAKPIEIDKQPIHSNKGASFIKVLGRDFYNQLQIPHEFTLSFNGYIPHRFIIESALTKKCWRVEVEEEGDGTIYFREGWPDFVKAHSLEVGNYLLFDYEEPSIFQVRIYGGTGCLKTAIPDIQGSKHSPFNIIDFEDKGDNEVSECELLTPRDNQSRSHKTRRPNICKYGNKYGVKKKPSAVPGIYTRTTTTLLTESSTSFSITMHKTMNHQFLQLHIPKPVSLAKNLANKTDIVLQNAMGNLWPVNLGHRRDGRSLFTGGWKEFLKDNDIAGGDTLSFDFISDNLVQVCVTKASQDEEPSDDARSQNGGIGSPDKKCGLDKPETHSPTNMSVETPITTKRGTKRASAGNSSSSFSFLWRKTTTGTYLHVPKIVVEGQKLWTKDTVVLRDPEGKCWPLGVAKRYDGRVALAKGWTEFWQGHSIKAGDSLGFDFVSDNLIQVKINRAEPLEAPRIKIEEAAIDTEATDCDQDVVMQAETIMNYNEPVTTLPEALEGRSPLQFPL